MDKWIASSWHWSSFETGHDWLMVGEKVMVAWTWTRQRIPTPRKKDLRILIVQLLLGLDPAPRKNCNGFFCLFHLSSMFKFTTENYKNHFILVNWHLPYKHKRTEKSTYRTIVNNLHQNRFLGIWSKASLDLTLYINKTQSGWTWSDYPFEYLQGLRQVF